MNKNIAIIDVETTGLVPGFNEIIEIGVIVCSLDEDNTLVKQSSFHSYIRPYHWTRMTPESREVNKIPFELLEEAPRPQSVRNDFEVWWSDAVGVKCTHAGHNPGFDKMFLTLFLGQKSYNDMFDYWTIDSKTIAWAQQLAGHIDEDTSLSLESLMGLFSIDEKPHSAMGDSWATLAVINKLVANQ